MEDLTNQTNDDKPRSLISFKEKIFNAYLKEMKVKTEEFSKIDEKINFHLLQNENTENYNFKIFKVAYFYDRNFISNKDFIHIPNFYEIAKNLNKYPILTATNEKNEICGLTTIKYQRNSDFNINPYFPIPNVNVLSITGILTRLNSKVPHIGRNLYESAIMGAYNLYKMEDFKLICEIDCRNINSIRSLTNAVRELQLKNINVELVIAGYYEIYKNKYLKEAPTFMFEIKFNKNKTKTEKEVCFSFEDCDDFNVLDNISKRIYSNVNIKRTYITYKNNQIIIYNTIKPINAFNIKVLPGTTAMHNYRVPRFANLSKVYSYEPIYENSKRLGDI